MISRPNAGRGRRVEAPDAGGGCATDIEIGSLTVADFAEPTLITGARCRLTLPYERPPRGLSGNTRAHWRTRSASTKQVRADVLALAQAANLHRLSRTVEHVTVELLWAPGDRRRRDADNLWPLLKVACDALARGRKDWVGLDLVADDTPEHMTKLAPRIEPPPAHGMWLDITLRFTS